jgi:Putative bacterial sensory transduction regulator
MPSSDRGAPAPEPARDPAPERASAARQSVGASPSGAPDRAPGRSTTSPLDVERWFGELGLASGPRAERDGVSSWDLSLDGRRRFDVPTTVILDPAFACIVWIHYAPPLTDGFRRSYRKLLRWNDEFPFAKFAIAADERPVLTAELPIDRLDRDELGLTIARLLAMCDQLAEESAAWIWLDGKVPSVGDRVSRQVGLFARYADRLVELVGP